MNETRDELTGAMLLEGSKQWLGLVRSAYAPSQSQIALIQAGADPEQFLACCMRALPPLSIQLNLFSLDSHYQSQLSQFPRLDLKKRSTDMSVSLSGDFIDYWADRTKNLQKNIQRYQTRSDDRFKATRLSVATGSEIGAGVARYGVLESQGWKGTQGTALHPDNRQGQLYHDILNNFGKTHDAFVFELWGDETLLASRLCIKNERMLVILKTTYNEEFRHLAPGRLNLHSVLEWLFENEKYKRLEFYTSADKNQLDWATHSRITHDASLRKWTI